MDSNHIRKTNCKRQILEVNSSLLISRRMIRHFKDNNIDRTQQFDLLNLQSEWQFTYLTNPKKKKHTHEYNEIYDKLISMVLGKL